MLIANAKASLGWFAHLFAQPLAQLIFFPQPSAASRQILVYLNKQRNE